MNPRNLLCLGLLAALLPAAPAAAKSKADLTVASGTVTATDGTLSGSFVVRNDGGRRAVPSTADVRLRQPGVAPSVVASFPVAGVKPGRERTVTVTATVPAGLAGTFRIRACADTAGAVPERNEANNCRRVGELTAAGPTGPTGPSGMPTGTPFELQSPESPYWAYVPPAYDGTPTTLFVWMHGCGGNSGGDIYTVAPSGDQRYIAISLGGRDADCWKVNEDQSKVLTAIAHAKTQFNIDPRRVVIGGYSSGGDLAYRTAFYNANTFAGVLAEDSAPFKDTGSTEAESLAAAAWMFNVVHVAHTGDTTYPIARVRQETDAMKAAGFPITRIERPGGHYGPHTDTDLQSLLLPRLGDGWLAP